MFNAWWNSVIFERWIITIIGLALIMHFELVVVTFNPIFWALILIGALMIIRIIGKGVWLNGNVK